MSTQQALGRAAVCGAQKSMQHFLRTTLDFLYLARYHAVYMCVYACLFVCLCCDFFCADGERNVKTFKVSIKQNRKGS